MTSGLHAKCLSACGLLTVIGFISPVAAHDSGLEEELQSLRERVAALEQALERQSSSSIPKPMPGLQEQVVSTQKWQSDEVATREPEPEQSRPEQSAFDLGGALRFTYYDSDFDDNVEDTRGRAGLDIIRLNAAGEFNQFELAAEYRFYPFMNTIHHGWLKYRFDEQREIEGGITQVPFGLLPYAAHNFWFGIPYYLGFADDYDLGIKYRHDAGPWSTQLGFFKNEELGDSTNLDRYSFDPVSVGDARNEETNTVNLRTVYTHNTGPLCTHEAGVSGQYGELYNRDTRKDGSHWAIAGHLDTRCGRWNLQLEYGRYNFEPENPAGVDDNVIRLGAFATSYDIAAEGQFAVANIAYNIPVNWPGVDLLTCYNDFSVLDKRASQFDNSWLNTTGCLLSTGFIFTYIDVIRGKNAPFIGNGSLAGGGTDEWDTRFNINLGIYW
ncbi:MAG: hypothetical protein WD356_06570 [Pseudomonadales bacterium]